MKRTFFLFSVLLAVLFISGCGQIRTDSASTEEELTSEGCGTTLLVEANFEMPAGRKVCRQAKEAIRDYIYRMFPEDGLEHASTDPDDILADCLSSSRRWFDDQLDWIDKDFSEDFGQMRLYFSGEVRSIYRDILCYCIYYSEYTGGAHPMDCCNYLNVDIRTGEAVTLDTLLEEGYEEPLAALVAESLRNTLEPDDYDAIGQEPGLPESYRIDEDGISFSYFSMYLFPGYLRGTEATVSWNELKDLMK